MADRRGSSRVLLIDGDLRVLDVLNEILVSAGHDVRATNDLQRALEFARTEDFDVVITDLGMPPPDGWAVSRLVKARKPETPVILLTAWGGRYGESDLLSQGVDLLLLKPLDLQDLIHAVEELTTLTIQRRGKRRRHMRVPGRRGEHIRVKPLSPSSSEYLGDLSDISRGGLSFSHRERGNLAGALLRIAMKPQVGLELDLSPSKVVYDVMMEQEFSFSELKITRRCGIQFENLSGERLSQLDSFIRARASESR